MSRADQERFAPHTLSWSDDPHAPTKTGPLLTEIGEQKQFASWLMDHKLMPPAVWHNTRKRSTGTVGCPDFIVPVAGLVLWLEFKLPGEDLSPDQKLFAARLREQGLCTIICYSAWEAVQAVEQAKGLANLEL